MNQFMSEVSVVPSSLWLGFCIGVFVLLMIDLSLFGKAGHKMSRKSALLESGLWITVALSFNAWFAMAYGKELGTEFLTGYLIEKSLSVDNLVVILLVFCFMVC
jgi:tellurite resistance protein TerC